MRAGISYAAGRLCIVATRPICLFAANNILIAAQAQALAVVLLASALAMVGVAAGAERRFYSRYFAADRSDLSLAFHVYASSNILLAALGCVTVLGIVLYFTGSIALAVVGMAYFISERLADEMLRLRLFERDFALWGRLSIVRGMLQLGPLALAFVVLGAGMPAWLAALILSLGTFAVFLPRVPGGLWRTLRPAGWKTASWLARKAAGALWKTWFLWAIALLGAAVGYLDRIIALVLDKPILPLFMLVVTCFSVVPMAVDFFYVSRHRREFLDQHVSIRGALLDRTFIASLGTGVLTASAACVAVLAFARNAQDFPLAYVLIIAGLQTTMAATSVPREILYWSQMLKRILRIELMFWSLFVVSAVIAWKIELATVTILALALICALVRGVLYMLSAARVSPAECAARPTAP